MMSNEYIQIIHHRKLHEAELFHYLGNLALLKSLQVAYWSRSYRMPKSGKFELNYPRIAAISKLKFWKYKRTKLTELSWRKCAALLIYEPLSSTDVQLRCE